MPALGISSLNDIASSPRGIFYVLRPVQGRDAARREIKTPLRLRKVALRVAGRQQAAKHPLFSVPGKGLFVLSRSAAATGAAADGVFPFQFFC